MHLCLCLCMQLHGLWLLALGRQSGCVLYVQESAELVKEEVHRLQEIGVTMHHATRLVSPLKSMLTQNGSKGEGGEVNSQHPSLKCQEKAQLKQALMPSQLLLENQISNAARASVRLHELSDSDLEALIHQYKKVVADAESILSARRR